MKKKTFIVMMLSLALALMLQACASSEGEGQKDEGKEPAPTPSTGMVWSADMECSACHVTEKASYDETAALASKHKDNECIACHDDASAIASVHEGVSAEDKLPKKLKSTEVGNDLCLSCHYGSKEALIEATPDVTVVDSRGNSYNPHNPPASSEHDKILCVDCHQVHTGKTIEQTALKGCYNCHHAEVFECGTCHAH